MQVTVLETDEYARRSEDLLSLEERVGVQAFLAENPDSGDLVPGLSGLRKLRWTQQSRNKGRRGGTRVIYFYAISHQTVVLVTVYSKEEKEDLTNADRKQLKKDAADIKAAIAASTGADQQARKGTVSRHATGRRPLPR